MLAPWCWAICTSPEGLSANTQRRSRSNHQLNLSAEEVDERVAAPRCDSDLAAHIVDTKRGKFDPKKFEDRYERAQGVS
jgi:non-homologous end joining protein Ku